jgi:alpha-D-xyloside xylohydrolase
MANLPVAQLLNTRLLESKDVVRVSVRQAEVIEIREDSLQLATSGVSSLKKAISSSDGAMAELARQVEQGEVFPGRLRIDLLTDSMLRVRYAQDAEIPANATAMVVRSFDGPTLFRQQVEEDRVEYETAELRVSVDFAPLRIRVTTAGGREVCAIGGPEKNHFNTWDAYNTGICRSLVDGSPIGVECFDLHPREAIYGMGEQFIRLDKVGQTIDLCMEEALGCTTPRSYKNVPFFMSTRGYGVFFNHSCRMTYWVGSMGAADLQVAVEDDFLDYYVMVGDLKQVLSQYTDITGKGQLPPFWSFGYWQSKISYSSAAECLDVVRRLREAEVPLDVIHLDTFWFKQDWYCDLEFDAERFPDPKGFIAELRELGVRVSLWQLPYIPEGCALFDELAAAGSFVEDGRGEIYDTGICMTPGFKGVVGCIDYTHPEARRIHQKYLGRLFEMGAAVIKADFGEQAPIDGVYHDGTPGARAHNLYPLLYNRVVAEVTEERTGEHAIWARSAWAGSQRYPLHWGGDSSPNWHNIVPQIEGGLCFGLSGFQFWSQDIGGFLGLTDGELLIRWMQFGVFLSHARIHGVGWRELDRFAPEVLRICRDYLRLRYRLLPYIYGSAIRCVERSLPMARALVLEFQDDPNVWNLGDEYLFGDSLLVAPITDETRQREVYLPAGCWTDWWTGERLEGGRWIHVEADIETLPLWAREGAIIPMGPAMSHTGEFPVEEIVLRIVPFQGDGESEFVVPVNDERFAVRYTASGGEHTLATAKSQVAFRVEILGDGGEKIGIG